MKITFCCTDTKAEPWLQGLAAALPGADISVWQPGAPQADCAVVWAPPQQFMDEQPGLKALFNIGAGVDALLKLRQVCCDPRLLKLEAARGVLESAKVQFLRDTLPEMIEEGRQILLFSQFTSMLALIEEELTKIGIPFVKLTGQTKDRATPIEEFQSGKAPVFLISLKAGGTGLNLTAADTVIHFDPWWNPAVENQATDRAYRIGQDKPVFVYKLITEGTVEEKIMLMQQRKATLLSGIFDGKQDTDGLFNADDLEALFEPLPQ